MATQEEVQPWVDDDNEEEPTDLAPLEEPPVAGASVLAALKAQRDAIAADRTLDVEVPGWQGLLVLRLGAITPGQQNAIAKRIAKTGDEQLPAANLDTLVAAYRCALGRTHAGGELEIIPDADGDPAGLRELVVEALELVPRELATNLTARQAIRLVFSLANSPETALVSTGNDWQAWATNASEETDEQFLGEA